jgi:hypothetical protein
LRLLLTTAPAAGAICSDGTSMCSYTPRVAAQDELP